MNNLNPHLNATMQRLQLAKQEQETQAKCRDIIEKMALYLSENPDKHPNAAWEVVKKASNLTELEMKEAMLVALLPKSTSSLN